MTSRRTDSVFEQASRATSHFACFKSSSRTRTSPAGSSPAAPRSRHLPDMTQRPATDPHADSHSRQTGGARRRLGRSPIRQRQLIPCPVAEVFPFFESARNLEDITPSWLGFHILEAPERRLVAGDLLEYRLRLFGIPLRWKTRILRLNPGRGFVDEQIHGPYKSWIHTHRFEPTEDGATLMEDRVDYRLPLGALGSLAGFAVAMQLRAVFSHRFRRVAELYPAKSRTPHRPLEHPIAGRPRKGT
jgi:ligand-binding SRPBCC domain-containing protein